jgi:hypothetical protein
MNHSQVPGRWPARLCLRRGRESARRGGRIASVSLSAVAALALAAAAAAPAMAGTTPSMITNGNSVNIAIQGPNDSLDFYWAVNGSSTWHAEQVAGTGTTYSAPSMTTDGNSVNIAAEGASQRLDFYWAVNGSSTWHPEQVG